MPLGAPTSDPDKPRLAYEPLGYDAISGWAGDDHAAALMAFIRGAKARLAAPPAKSAVPPPPGLLDVCRAAIGLDPARITAASARAFFESAFVPYAVAHTGAPGMVTGYYEPVLDGSRTCTGDFRIPVYRRPPDLENLVAEHERGAMAHALTHARRTANGLEPYATRQEIETGALANQGLELVWLQDPVDCFFMHVQGSGAIRFQDGSTARITYDGKNGHPYTSIGRHLIDRGLFTVDEMSLATLKTWLASDPARGRAAMWKNKSFVFFRELSGAEAESPLGAMHTPLSEGRSLAVDTAYHAIATPIFVTAETLTHATGAPFRRLMIAQDVGSAIRGPERGDIYFGSGDTAGQLAGVTKHPAKYVVLLPRQA